MCLTNKCFRINLIVKFLNWKPISSQGKKLAQTILDMTGFLENIVVKYSTVNVDPR
jgi:hypothetical protein